MQFYTKVSGSSRSPRKRKKVESPQIQLGNLKDFIHEFLSCRRSQQVSQPLEKHFFLYLSDRNKVRSKVIQQASQIVNAVKFFRKTDSTVEFFAKALKHECPETFYDFMVSRTSLVNQLASQLQKHTFPDHSLLPISTLTKIAIKLY